MVINVAHRELVGIGDGGILIWLWDPRIHLIGRLIPILIMINMVVIVIGLFRFWNVMRGDVETYSIWRNIFSLSIPKIEFGSGFADFEFTKMPLQDMIHGSGFISFRNFILRFQDKRIQSGYDGKTIMIRVAHLQQDGSIFRLAWDPNIILFGSSTTNKGERASFYFLEFTCCALDWFPRRTILGGVDRVFTVSDSSTYQ
jgi:hypothetical protein